MSDFATFVPLDLTPSLRRLWNVLSADRGNVAPYSELLKVQINKPTLKVQICNLRAELGGSPVRIEAVRGLGYRLAPRRLPK